jgi:hypothetical protein
MDEGRFPPGTLLAQRYRIVSLLGRGGMGEVYRANDLLLGQTVALKFLPAQWTSHEGALARFRNEVRIARQISHPNVCRVYDIGEAEGATYLSMEYVDGEDLASLLRRIGTLPRDKALEIARQLCAGLAAAHDKGVVHRDLKPGNIMLDGQGRLRITDFGLAGIAGEVKDIRSGTRGYMAPEQQSGQEVTPRSDIYALGVVLHEVSTGKRPSADSSHPDLAPEVDRVIRRCLAEDPAKRPASALQVAAALPGGDPLAAALAAGETPSPEMVAAAGEAEGLRPLVAWALLAGVIVAVVSAILLSAQSMLYRRVPLDKTPEVLAERARSILQSAGYSEPPVDTAMGFYAEKTFLGYIAEHDKSRLSGGGVWCCSSQTRVVYPLRARLSSAATPFGSRVGVSWRARDNLRYIAQLGSSAWHPARAFVYPGPFPGFAAQGVGGSGRIRSFVHGPLRRLGPVCPRCLGDRFDLLGSAGISVDPLRPLGFCGSRDLRWSFGVLSSDDPRVCVVCGHQSGRDSADGRDGALRLLHVTWRPTCFRKRRARGVS